MQAKNLPAPPQATQIWMSFLFYLYNLTCIETKHIYTQETLYWVHQFRKGSSLVHLGMFKTTCWSSNWDSDEKSSKISFSFEQLKVKEEMEEQKTLNTPLGSLTKRKRSLPIFVFWQSLPFLSIPCVCNVWKFKRGMRRQMRSKRLSDALVYRVLSFLREMTLETHSSQAWDVELGKGLTAEPWATKRSVSSSIVPWEQQKSVSTDRGVKWDEKQREGEMGKS